MNYELIATATFGLEAVVRREIEALGYEVLKTEDGKVTFAGDERAIVRSNLWLRCADRVLLKALEFEALEFEDLFQGITNYPWERIIPVDGKFTVTCSTVKSKLHNPPAIQSVSKKAIVERMKMAYGFERFKETGAEYTVKVTMLKDRATVTIDTSGTGLHKRGYRVANVDAPIKETMAAALISLSFWKPGRVLVDPCCGSGTIPIEAALMAGNIAPGLSREFASEGWHIIGPAIWKEERKAAFEAIKPAEVMIYAGDIDTKAIKAAKENAAEAGVEDCINILRADIKDTLTGVDCEDAVIVTNLPYGERIGTREEIKKIYKALKAAMGDNPRWSAFAITSDKEMEKAIGRRAERRRKLYNGNIETTYYQFHGKKRSFK